MTSENQENSFPCRECDEYFSEESGASEDNFICEACYAKLEENLKESSPRDVYYNIIDSKNPNSLIESIEIEDKVKCALWCGLNFESEKADYLEYGHTNESYEGFLVQTYVSTSESMPESIADELNLPMYNEELEKK